MNHSRHSYISLADEIEVLRLYLDMERLRFKDAFDYRIDVEEELDTDEVRIPPLLVQPFVENAVWHGLMHKEERGIPVDPDTGKRRSAHVYRPGQWRLAGGGRGC